MLATLPSYNEIFSSLKGNIFTFEDNGNVYFEHRHPVNMGRLSLVNLVSAFETTMPDLLVRDIEFNQVQTENGIQLEPRAEGCTGEVIEEAWVIADSISVALAPLHNDFRIRAAGITTQNAVQDHTNPDATPHIDTPIDSAEEAENTEEVESDEIIITTAFPGNTEFPSPATRIELKRPDDLTIGSTGDIAFPYRAELDGWWSQNDALQAFSASRTIHRKANVQEILKLGGYRSLLRILLLPKSAPLTYYEQQRAIALVQL